MGEILTFTPRKRGPHLVTDASANFFGDRSDPTSECWQARHLSEAMASLAVAGVDIAEAQKLFHQQHTDPQAMISAETIESIVLALIPTIHLCGMTNRDRALYAALLHWLQGYRGGDHAG